MQHSRPGGGLLPSRFSHSSPLSAGRLRYTVNAFVAFCELRFAFRIFPPPERPSLFSTVQGYPSGAQIFAPYQPFLSGTQFAFVPSSLVQLPLMS
jgi:hypothetical protein